MSIGTTTLRIPSADIQRRAPALATVRDAVAVAGRDLIALRRVPQLLVFATVQPVIFVLVMRYVFGGAIATPGVAYVDYLMPGIFVSAVLFGAMSTAIGLATDVKSGLLERFRALPMARSAVLGGRSLADLVRNVFAVALMVLVGYAVGFRVHTSVLGLLGAVLLLLLFGFALSWVFALVGLSTGDPETAQAASLPLSAPLLFVSSAFVPVSSMPTWLRGFASHQPVSVTTSAARALVTGGAATSDLLQSVGWCAAIVAVFAALAVRRYRRAV